MSTAPQQAYVPRRSPVLDSNLITRDWDVWFQNIATNLSVLNTETSAWFDPKTEGAVEIAGVNNLPAIQRTVDHVVDAGGGILLLSGNFDIDGEITVNMGAANNGLTVLGLGRGRSGLRQLGTGNSTWRCGANRSQVCDNLVMSDFTLDGNGLGGTLLRLNNCLNGSFQRLAMTGADYGIYTEGQNERHAFRDLYLQAFTQNGILAGQSNGETTFGGTLDYPVLQKCLFQHVRVGGCDAAAFVITAGILDAIQRASGINRLERIVLEGNKQNGVEFHFSFMSAISGLSNEDYLDTDAVYYALLIEDGSMVSAKDMYLGCGAQVNDYAAKIRLNGGTLFLSDSTVSGAHVSAVADISVLGTLEATNVIVTDKDAIVFDSGASRDKCLLTSVFDAAGLPIVDWDPSIKAVAAKDSGVYMPQTTVGTMTIRVVDAAGQLVAILQTDGSNFNRLVFNSTTVNDVALQPDGAGGLKVITGNVSGMANLFAKSFNLETPANYTVTNPVTNRSIDVSAATLADVRQVLGTVIADLIAAGLYQ